MALENPFRFSEFDCKSIEYDFAKSQETNYFQCNQIKKISEMFVSLIKSCRDKCLAKIEC